MENYVCSWGTEEWHFRSDGLPPIALQQILLAGGMRVARRTTKLAPRQAGPNYDGTYNSVLAARRYSRVRRTCRALVLEYYLDHVGQWIDGRTFVNLFGTEALRRSRELRDTYGWPIIEEPQGKGVTWRYQMDLSGMQKVITWRRRSPRAA